MKGESFWTIPEDYTIVRFLGKGKGGYSYLAADGHQSFVEKRIHHEPCDYYQFGDKIQAEIHDYGKLKAIGIRMPKLLAVDVEKEIIYKEYLPGPTIFEMVEEGMDVSAFLPQVREMCSLLYQHHTNIDYYPTNFIVKDGLLHYIDFECNDYREEWNFENWGIKYWSRTPEFEACLNKK